MWGRVPDHLAAHAQRLLPSIFAGAPEQPRHGLRLLRMRIVAQWLQALEPIHLCKHALQVLVGKARAHALIYGTCAPWQRVCPAR